ncbi:hypothetical protein QVD17_18248 [Tagetes erecta]|uniref:Uncharacterized protein n=1 Tax=Tagetes erecta TaxID=13708 RepID=A0AAD8NVX0_TARER|nr:hypothetical protein QVD17_18248 [Tagetes erecta]
MLAMVSGSGGGDGPMARGFAIFRLAHFVSLEMVAVPWVRVTFSLPGDVCDDGGGTIGLNPVDDVDFQICVVVGAIGCGFSLKRTMMIMRCYCPWRDVYRSHSDIV